jgi:hypothetical protein
MPPSSNSGAAMNDLEESLREALAACVARGMALPFIVTAVAKNGSLFAMRVRGDESPGEEIVMSSNGDGFTLPINIMVVDADGEAARVLIVQNGTVSVH